MLGKLAVRNVKRQISSYMIYFITVAFTVALMFAINNVLFAFNQKLRELLPDDPEYSTNILVFFIVLVTFVVGFIICYATVFLLRKRKKELGTYLLMGIRRSDVLKIFIVENLIIGALSFLLGCLLGLGVFQILNSVVGALMGGNFGSLGYRPESIWLTLLQWAGIFSAAVIFSAFVLARTKIGDLLKEKTTEKSPKHPKAVKTVKLAVTLGIMAVAFVVLGLLLAFIFDTEKHQNLNMSSSDYALHALYIALCLAAIIACVFIMPKKPFVERGIAILMVGVIGGLSAFGIWIFTDAFSFMFDRDAKQVFDEFTYIAVLPAALGLFVAAIFIFYFFSRGFYSSRLNKPKKFKGSNAFHYRQMTSALSGNAAIMGVIALLLSLAFFFSNFAYSTRYVQMAEINQYTQFDVIGGWSAFSASTNTGMKPGEVVKEAEKYSPVTFSREYGLYHSVLRDTDTSDWIQQARPCFGIIKQSDINALMKELRLPEYTMAGDGFYVLEKELWMGGIYDGFRSGDVITVFGKELQYEGERSAQLQNSLRDTGWLYDYFIAVPDTVISEQEWEKYLQRTVLAMNTKHYLPPAFSSAVGDNVETRYARIDSANADSAILIVSVLYSGVTFMFFAMALLSLKVMSDADKDKKRYSILNMLGVGERRQRKILFRQIMAFFAAPMLIPFLVAIPSVVFSALWSYYMLGFVPAAIYWIGAAIPLICSGIYACYFGATYYLSVKNSIKPIEKPRIKLLEEEKS